MWRWDVYAICCWLDLGIDRWWVTWRYLSKVSKIQGASFRGEQASKTIVKTYHCRWLTGGRAARTAVIHTRSACRGGRGLSRSSIAGLDTGNRRQHQAVPGMEVSSYPVLEAWGGMNHRNKLFAMGPPDVLRQVSTKHQDLMELLVKISSLHNSKCTNRILPLVLWLFCIVGCFIFYLSCFSPI